MNPRNKPEEENPDLIVKRNSIPEGVCDCECHVIGKNILHFYPCCSLCYEKYIEKDGKMNLTMYAEAIKRNKRGNK